MKFFRFLMVLAVVLLAGGQPSFAQSSAKKEKEKGEKQLIKNLIESGRYKLEIDEAVPSGGATKHLSTDYLLELRGDSVISHLPYFGRAYSVPYGGGDGLNFTAITTDYKLSFNKKGMAKITFKAKTNEDTFSFTIKIFDNGSATVSVTSINRQSIVYRGEMEYEDD